MPALQNRVVFVGLFCPVFASKGGHGHKEWEFLWSPITAKLSAHLLTPLWCNHDQLLLTFR